MSRSGRTSPPTSRMLRGTCSAETSTRPRTCSISSGRGEPEPRCWTDRYVDNERGGDVAPAPAAGVPDVGTMARSGVRETDRDLSRELARVRHRFALRLNHEPHTDVGTL